MPARWLPAQAGCRPDTYLSPAYSWAAVPPHCMRGAPFQIACDSGWYLGHCQGCLYSLADQLSGARWLDSTSGYMAHYRGCSGGQ